MNKTAMQTNVIQANDAPAITPDMLQKYDVAGPRYTSYPTADRFVEAFTENAYLQALEQRRMTGANLPLSIYVHIPFCESLCFFLCVQQNCD